MLVVLGLRNSGKNWGNNMDERQRKEKELELLELEEAEAQASAGPVALPANDPKTGIVPAEEQAKFTPEQALAYDAGGWDAGATEPEEMRALRHVNEVGGGYGVAQLGATAAKVAAGIGANLPKVANIRNQLASWFEKKSAEQAAKAGGAGSAAELELGAEGTRNYGRMLQDKGIVEAYRSPETSEQIVSGLKDVAGKQIGAARNTGDLRSLAQGVKRPTTLDIERELQAKLGPKYNTGLESGQKGEMDNAIEELRKLSPVNKSTTGDEIGQTMENLGGTADDAYLGARKVQEGPFPEMADEFPYLHDQPTFTELFDKSTAMNQAATNARAIQRPSGALTETADVLAKKSTEGLENFLDPAEQAGYAVAKKDWGDLSLAENLMAGKTSKGFANSQSLPVSKFGALSRVINEVAPNSAIMALDKKIELILRTRPEALGEYSQLLGDALKRGAPALASTMFVLQQQDPSFQEAIKELDGNGR